MRETIWVIDYKFVWLQHGVTQNDIAKAANRLNTLDDIITASSYGEYDQLSRENYLYQKEEIQLTGFARFDKLLDKKEKINHCANMETCFSGENSAQWA